MKSRQPPPAERVKPEVVPDAAGDKMLLNSRQTRLESGRLTQESFEGEFEGEVFESLAASAQRQALAQLAQMWRIFRGFSPLPRRQGDRD